MYLYLNELYSSNKFKKSAIGKQEKHQIQYEIRGDYIHWIQDDDLNTHETLFNKHLQDFIDYLNQTCYTGIVGKELHYALYP